MDWKSAKIILIFIFILLNIVLAVVLYKNFNVEVISQQTIDNTGNILVQNNVNIECPIPRYIGRDYILQHVQKSINKDMVISALLGNNFENIDNNTYKNGEKLLEFSTEFGFEYTDKNGDLKVNSATKDGIETFLKGFTEKLDIPFDEFKSDGYYHDLKTNDLLRFEYKGYFKGYDVFDNYIDIEVSKLGITEIKYQYKKPVSITKRDINVIPAYEILITKVTNYPGILIKDIDLGFKGYTHVDKETKTLYEGLAWRVKDSAGEEYYFNARNGEKIE